MANLNRFKFTFGKKTLTLTTEHDNLFMEEIAKVATEKYEAIKEQMPGADDETVAILLAVNCLSTQLSREIEFDDKEQELESLRIKWLRLNKSRVRLRIPYDFHSTLINPCLELLYWLPQRNYFTSILSCSNDCLCLFCQQILSSFRAEV